jgi:hypothetical protein
VTDENGRSWSPSRWASLVAALLFLDISLTFDNLWPTPAISWHGRVSVELAVLVLALVLLGTRRVGMSRRALRWLSALWLLFVIGRYAEVTAPGLYGRDVNLYWDLRYIPDVSKMVAAAAPLWLLVVAFAGVVAVAIVFYAAVGSALGRVSRGSVDPRERPILAALAVAVLIVFAGLRLGAPENRIFSKPVVETYRRQARIVVSAFLVGAGADVLPSSPRIGSDLSLVEGADVLLVFVESYGAVAFDRPEFTRALAPSRDALERTIRGTSRDVVSTFVESPTFGGSSWLAHLSLMSGLDVRDPDAYETLMSQKRRTMTTAFGEHGFRTVALMPGLKKSWPEGAFYGFDDIYDAKRLDYRGTWFGWFGLPDQFSLARLDALELGRGERPPLFVFFPTLSTHFPFGPAPPYQPDWERVLTQDPYDSASLYRALADEPDWKNFGPSYVKAVAYAYETFDGYLRLRPDRDLVMILVGDHQPPAAVSGQGARWDVPVHVIASRPRALQRLVARGFQPGLTPSGRAIGRMHVLLPVFMDAFGS